MMANRSVDSVELETQSPAELNRNYRRLVRLQQPGRIKRESTESIHTFSTSQSSGPRARDAATTGGDGFVVGDQQQGRSPAEC